MEEKKYAVTLEFKVGVTDDDLTFNVKTEYHQVTVLYVKDAMTCLMFKLPEIVRAGWIAFEGMDANVKNGFEHKIKLDFCTQDGDEWDVSAKVDNPNEIGHTLIGIIEKILLKDPVIDEILQNAK
ncbi:hypothetical protein [Haemophilus influenzae]|uniref:Uncharacterized protein n=1 Tax=Haemophilus influenzae TaxID=727 RepID=A0AAX3INQ1_HAEIF|nr:hypothetical protein [Haemophilus influenzae]RFN93006.1 hypothetical protein CH638_08720 [Haemophilus influenzae]VTX47958.1 Uncharacterised protein [Haemophilus influenzae]